MTCRLCHRPLEATDRLRGLTLCRRAACMGRNEAARIEAQRQAMADAAMAAVQALQPGPRVQEAVWLLPFTVEVVHTTDAEREALRSALLPQAAEAARALAAMPSTERVDAPAIDAATSAAASADPPPSATGRLCAHCGGRCCTAGLDDDAFLHDGALQRWLAAHPGQPPEAAVAAYIGLLPQSHVQGSCLFHTAQGCALSREDRGDTCNSYGCLPWKRVEAAVAQQPPQDVLVLRARGGLLESATVITAEGGLLPLPWPGPAPAAG